MDYHYKDFWDLANRVYVGKVDSLSAHSGKNRIELHWKKSPDPTVSGLAIYWNNGADSLLISIEGLESDGWLTTVVPGLSEDTHVFEVFGLDKDGNRSVPVEVIARVYGDVYENGLANRVIREQVVDGSSLSIWWFADDDPTLIGTEIHYLDDHEVDRIAYHPSVESNVIIDHVDFQQEIKYRSLYRPDTLAIDTFYTSFSPILLEQ